MKSRQNFTQLAEIGEQPWFVLNSSYYSSRASSDSAIAGFFTFDTTHATSFTIAVPDGCVDVLFDCDTSRPTAKIYGTPLIAKRAKLIKNHRYFGVRYKPGIIPSFTTAPAEDLPEQEIDLLDVAPNGNWILERITQTPAFEEQAKFFESLASPQPYRETSALTPMLIRKILLHRGDIRIQQLESMSGYTERTIQRQFKQDTGMTPKIFCRIIRLQTALNTLSNTDGISLSQLATELGFADQSHFQCEFKKLVSTTPLDFHQKIIAGGYSQRIHISKA